jgi:hypothetical protein
MINSGAFDGTPVKGAGAKVARWPTWLEANELGAAPSTTACATG